MSQATAIDPFPELSNRRWQRYKVNVPIRVIVSHAMKASIFDGRGTSLSEGGMALFAGAELRPGDQVAVEFTPPFSTPPIRVDARICNRTGYHYGVEFVAVDSRQRDSVALLRMHLASFAILI
jgi:PilZ domain